PSPRGRTRPSGPTSATFGSSISYPARSVQSSARSPWRVMTIWPTPSEPTRRILLGSASSAAAGGPAKASASRLSEASTRCTPYLRPPDHPRDLLSDVCHSLHFDILRTH